METININTNVIKHQAEYIKDNLESYNTGVNSVKSTVSSIGSIWKDNGYKNFASKMDEFMKELQDLEQSRQSYQEFAKGYAEAHETLDESYSGKRINIR